ncbi:MAG: hypothetical protein GXP49_07730 [Deltaproteobacteria bacterium]|nr:hypothetical protein [Deltaproteobacteria bacterium]
MNINKMISMLFFAVLFFVPGCGGDDDNGRCGEYCSKICSRMADCGMEYSGSPCKGDCLHATGLDEFSKLSCNNMYQLVNAGCDSLEGWTGTWGDQGWNSFPKYQGTLKIKENTCFPGLDSSFDNVQFEFSYKVFHGRISFYLDSKIVATPSKNYQDSCVIDETGACTWSWMYLYNAGGNCSVNKTDSIVSIPTPGKLGGEVSVHYAARQGDCTGIFAKLPCDLSWTMDAEAISSD